MPFKVLSLPRSGLGRFLVLAAVAASFAGHGNCAASATANASATNFRYVLTDLDPDDGIFPSLAWLATPEHGEPQVRGSYGGWSVFTLSPQGNERLSEQWTQGDNAVSGTIEGAADLATTSISVSATNARTGDSIESSNTGGTSRTGAFLLSAGSSVSFLIDYEVSGLLTVPHLPGNFADATAGIAGSLFNPDGTLSDQGSKHAGNGDVSGSIRNGTLSFSLSNWSDDSRQGTTSFGAGAFAQVMVVPEPSTYGMFLAGLALIPVLRRRIR